MSYPILEPITDTEIERKSSIKQYDSVLAVQKAGVWLPIVSDMIDYVDCDGVHSHEVILTDNDDYIGYEYPVEQVCYYTADYTKSDRVEDVIEQLPEWFGNGFYEKHISEETLTNSDENALGVQNKTELTIGLDYYLAKNKLPAEK